MRRRRRLDLRAFADEEDGRARRVEHRFRPSRRTEAERLVQRGRFRRLARRRRGAGPAQVREQQTFPRRLHGRHRARRPLVHGDARARPDPLLDGNGHGGDGAARAPAQEAFAVSAEGVARRMAGRRAHVRLPVRLPSPRPGPRGRKQQGGHQDLRCLAAVQPPRRSRHAVPAAVRAHRHPNVRDGSAGRGADRSQARLPQGGAPPRLGRRPHLQAVRKRSRRAAELAIAEGPRPSAPARRGHGLRRRGRTTLVMSG